MRIVTGALSLAVALSTSGCATLTASKYATLQVASNPPGAEVRLYGSPAGRTPVALELDKSRIPSVEVAAQGYAPQTCRVRMSPAIGYVVADVILCVFLFPLGCISFIDAIGAWNELESPACTVDLGAGGVFGQPPAGYPPAQGYPPAGSYPPSDAYPPPPPPADPGGQPAYPPPPPPM